VPRIKYSHVIRRGSIDYSIRNVIRDIRSNPYIYIATTCGCVHCIHDASRRLFTCAVMPRCIGAAVRDFRLSWPPVYSVLFCGGTYTRSPELPSLGSRNEDRDTVTLYEFYGGELRLNQALKSPWIATCC